MTVTNAMIGLGIAFALGNGIQGASTSYNQVADEITNITTPRFTREAVDVTHLQSPEGWREFIAGLKDADEVTISFNYAPGDDGPLLVAFNAGYADIQFTFPGGFRMQFSGVVTGYKPGDGTLTTMVGEFTLKPSGKPVLLAP